MLPSSSQIAHDRFVIFSTHSPKTLGDALDALKINYATNVGSWKGKEEILKKIK